MRRSLVVYKKCSLNGKNKRRGSALPGSLLVKSGKLTKTAT